ncbi:copper resistance CopC/CopD family protein [Mangrovihabitans endophyticus]|uniref:copper resistance CopC/CopD family protein n=1 Tax=Mangrovihabitans endophyticus TaxID=1751298 RepID=UPI0016671CA2|nr:copper resistance protein CopC [Mangrovihabitans endophyticus]
MRRVLVSLVTLVVTGLVVLLGPASAAQAHAALLTSTPAPGSIVGSSPAEVTVTFSEAITPVAGRITVLAPDGRRISGEATARGAVLRIPVRRADRPLGTYLVSYRVISADSHPVAGGLTFSVGAPSATPPAADGDGDHASVAVAVPAARYAGYAGLALIAGPALLLASMWPRRLSRRPAVVLVRAGLVLVAAGTCASLWAQAPDSSGGPLWDFSASALRAVLTSAYGVTLCARLAALAVVAALLPPVLRGVAGRGRTALVIALGAATLTTWPLVGHAVASPLAPAIVASDVVHLAAMSVWLGGLVTLATVVLPRTPPRVLQVILAAWSRTAAIAVVWLVGGGVVQAVVQVGSVPALVHTGYGRLLLIKVAVLAVTLTAAGYARTLVRRAQVPAAGAARLRRTVGAEVLATAVVLAISAVLVQVNPGRTADTDAAAVSEEGVSQTLTCDLFTLQFNIYPVQLGENNTIHAYVYTPAGAALPAKEWTVTSTLTGRGLEPVRTPMLGLDPEHHAVGAITFPLPGVYQVAFTVRVSEIDQATVRTTVTVDADRRGSQRVP